MRELPVVTNLSIALTREIGRVMVGHAFLEHCLSRIIYKLIDDVDPKIGRLAVREPRAIDRLELIFDLTEVQGIQLKIGKTLYRDAIKMCASQRDQLAHGIWVRDPKTHMLFLRITKGSWQPVKGQRGKTKRLIKPEAIQYDAKDARTLRLIIDETTNMINELGVAIQAALGSSQKKSQ